MYSDCLSPIHSKSICYRADAIMANDNQRKDTTMRLRNAARGTVPTVFESRYTLPDQLIRICNRTKKNAGDLFVKNRRH